MHYVFINKANLRDLFYKINTNYGLDGKRGRLVKLFNLLEFFLVVNFDKMMER